MNVIRPPRDCGVYCKNGTKPAARAELSRRQIDTGRYQAKFFDARIDAAARLAFSCLFRRLECRKIWRHQPCLNIGLASGERDLERGKIAGRY